MAKKTKIIDFNRLSNTLSIDGQKVNKTSYRALNRVLWKIDQDCQIIKHFDEFKLNNKGKFYCLNGKIIINL